jgi:hypothetical protein
LIRFLTFVAIIIGVFYGAMFVLGTFLEPEPREITRSIRNIELR